MYNKHKNEKIMFQAIVDNRTCIQFNTSKKRDTFAALVAKMPNRKITYKSAVAYPWNIEDGTHGLTSPKDFAQLINCSVDKVNRAIRNGFLQTEYIAGQKYIVSKHGTYSIKGVLHSITK